MSLFELLDQYLAERDASPRYQESLRRTVRRAAAYGVAETSAITPSKVNDFLRSAAVSAVTRSNMRRELLTLWRWAYDRGIIETPPLRVMAIKATPRPPRAWSLETLRKLLDIAEKDEKPVSARHPGLRRCDVLPAWIAVAYDSGIRLGDILSLRTDAIRNGCVSLVAQKTGKLTTRRLSEYAAAKALELAGRGPGDSVFAWALPRRRAILMWRSFLKENNITGSPRWLRRSGATYVEAQQPGQATRFLGHSAANPGLAARFYIDASLSCDLPPSPPPLR